MGNAQAFGKTDKLGFQIISVAAHSPGAQAGLQVNDDFVLTMNGLAVPFMEVEKIMSMVKNSVNRPILLTVYNTKTLNQRDVVLTPSNDWPGEGLLGIKIKLNTYESLHVDLLNVYGQEHDFEDIVATTPKKTTPSGKFSRNFSFGESEFSSFDKEGSVGSNDRSATPLKDGVMKMFNFGK